MKRFLVLQILSLLVIVTSVATSHATSLYSQVIPSDPIGAFSSNGDPMSQKIADDFRLDTGVSETIRSVRLIGGYSIFNQTSVPLPSDNFRIMFFEDVGGAPGQVIEGGDFAVGSAVKRSATGGSLLNGPFVPYEYLFDLGVGVTLPSFTRSWISVTNNTQEEVGWLWARAFGNVNASVAATNDFLTDPWILANNGGMYFELSNRAVPEPATLFVIVVALGSFSVTRRRCKLNLGR